jgi:hypothetical protein
VCKHYRRDKDISDKLKTDSVVNKIFKEERTVATLAHCGLMMKHRPMEQGHKYGICGD